MKKIILSILMLHMVCCVAKSFAAAVPDSLLTLEHTYYFAVSDPVLAQQILDELKLRRQDKDWELEWAQGDLYFNTGKYRLALHFLERVSGYGEVKDNPKLMMGLASTMMEAYRMNNDLDNTMRTARQVADLAEELGDRAEAGRAYMFMGKVAMRQQNEKLSNEYFDLAEKNLEQAEDYAYLYHFNLTVANLLHEYGKFTEAGTFITKAESNLKKMEETIPDLPQGQIDFERGRLYALASDVYYKVGRWETAKRYYTGFMESSCAKDIRGKIYIVPYLLQIRNYREAITISRERISQLRENVEILGEDMSAALSYLMQGYEMSGETAQALAVAKEAIELNRNLRKKDQEQAAQELAVIYNVNEKEAQLVEQSNTLERRNILVAGLLMILLLAVITILLVLHNMRLTRRKNLAMVRQIREMQAYREQVEKLHQPPYGSLSRHLPPLEKQEAEKTKPVYDHREITATDRPEPGGAAGKRSLFELFLLIDNKIRSEKLYLNPGITRDDVIGLLGVKRTDFIQAIGESEGRNFTDYINELRLEEALLLLENAHALTIESIAKKAGFGSVRSLYRQFKNKYNMSPAEYRKLI